MIFELGIKCDNAAFATENGGPQREVARILRDLADRVEDGGNYFPLRDVVARVGTARYRMRGNLPRGLDF